MIAATRVTKTYGRFRAVDGASFELSPGESLALWGSNGAGKTTLIRCVLGITRFRGSVTINGVDVSRRGKIARSMIGYVPQELAFHDDARVGPSLMFFAGLRRVSSRAASRSLESVGLAGNERKRLRDLSGGMKQRLALAVALLSDPPVIVLDEPTSNLDASGRSEVADSLRAQRALGKTMIFASHRPDEVRALASRVLVMERGRVARDTTPEELWGSGGDPSVMRIMVEGAGEQVAAEILRRAGHKVSLNGHGLCVTVEEHRKAAPIESLFRADVRVRDIEFLERTDHSGAGS